jgi:HTH-like domain
LEAALWRVAAVRGEKAAPGRGGECAAAQGRRRPDARQGDAAGGDPPKTMTPARGREMIDFVRDAYAVSIRRACRAIPACRASYHYRSRRPEQAPLRKRIREIAETRMRYGYRRITVLLRREGWRVNVKRVRRLYNLEGLQMRHKPPRRRVMAKLRADRSDATGPNQVWAMDWMYDELFDGRRLWVLTVVDTWSRICPVLRVCRSATAMEVAGDDPCRPGEPVYLEGARPLGLFKRRHPGLQPTREADRQCIRGKLQCDGAARVPGTALVPGSGRRPGKG